MQAIILAAGMGKRLKELTSEATKCMVKVNGVAMIDRMMGHLLWEYCSFQQIMEVLRRGKRCQRKVL